MKTRMSILVTLVAFTALVAGALVAQDQRRVPSEFEGPSLAKEYASDKPTSGLLATANFVVAVTERGAFALSAEANHHAVFEYVQKGFDETLKYLGSSGGFLYFSCDKHQIIMAIRNAGPHDIWFFINGGTQAIKYSNSSRIFPGLN